MVKPERFMILTIFELPTHLSGLLDYMIKSDKVEKIKDYDPALLNIFSDDVLAKIKAGARNWEEDVPDHVVKAIKFYNLFGYNTNGHSTAKKKAAI